MKQILLIAIAIVVLPAAALAQADGTWTGETQGRGGVQAVTVTLDGATGTWVQGELETELAEITVNGNEVSFQRTVNFGGRGGFALTYNGVIDGDEMTLTMSLPEGRGGRGPRGGGAPQPIVLTRQ